MDNTIVIYKSKYGATKQYASWLSEELHCQMISADEIKGKELENYSTIVFGGGIHAGGITGLSLIKKNYKRIQDKNIIIFAVGINTEEEKNMEDLREINFNGKIKDLPCYLIKGAYDPRKVKGFDNFLMKQVRKMIMKKPIVQRTDQEKALVKVIDYGCDCVDRENLRPILDAIYMDSVPGAKTVEMMLDG